MLVDDLLKTGWILTWWGSSSLQKYTYISPKTVECMKCSDYKYYGFSGKDAIRFELAESKLGALFFDKNKKLECLCNFKY